MPSKRKMAPIVGRDGINGGRGGREQEVSLVEIDTTLAAALQLQDGQKIMATIHLEPPIASTINIEPLTPEDWEIIELHATFLELNLQHQVRALPNPSYAGTPGAPPNLHPLTLHLSPTSTANIRVVSIEPPLPADVPFAKMAPDAEVIVAPKVRSKQTRSNKDSKSVGGTSGKSAKSSASTARRKSAREERKPALFLRGVERALCQEWFDDETPQEDLSVWVDRDLLLSKDFSGVKWVTVNVLRPAGLQQPVDPQSQVPEGEIKGSARLVARLRAWEDPPDGQTAALSSPLCAALGTQGMVGGVVKIEPAPLQVPRKTAPDADGISRDSIQSLRVIPFLSTGSASQVGLKFGGESKAEMEESVKRIKHIYGSNILQGPLTHGQVLGLHDGLVFSRGWEGGILQFDVAPALAQSLTKEPVNWISGSEWKLSLELGAPIPRPAWLSASDEQTPASSDDILVGIDALLKDMKTHLSHMSSVLLTGGQGAGKSAVAKSVVAGLRSTELYHTTYFPCTRLVNDETRVSTIKETLNRLFMRASWGARLGGKAIVILDDLDRLCPAETELQVGNENGRSRQISEAICAIVRQYCGRDSNVALLATAQGKDSLHNVVVGGHVVREIVELKAPDKEARRRVLEAIARENSLEHHEVAGKDVNGSRPTTADGSVSAGEGNEWMDGASQHSTRAPPENDTGFLLDPELDFLDIAGHTDGYMPGDLLLLVSRARNEALIRSVIEDAIRDDSSVVQLGRGDFTSALKGFTPASLRNVTLQSSTTTFDSIGGLQETRRVLLETLQYPTKYAPIFAQCPLRLRSGLLLYGYPGCGKTLLASAVAGECGLNFISVKGPEILNKYIGASEKSVRDLFERASAAKPCVLFFDEFDSIAPKRGHDSTGVTDRVVNQLLTQMDGAEGLSGVYVLAATSRPDLIDPALLRPGRLDKSLLCDFPNLDERLDIITALTKKVKLSEEVLGSQVDFHELGRRTEGFSGADLQALVSNAQLEAIHDVLSDREHDAPSAAGGGRRGAARKVSSSLAAPGRAFVQFRYGADEAKADADHRVTAGATRSVDLAEQAAIAAKLEGIKIARKRARHAEKTGPGATAAASGEDNKADNKSGSAQKEVVIRWKHLIKALDSTRASISSDERRRLARIYHEFVVGRSGEMKDGQGSMEIGGRSSLM